MARARISTTVDAAHLDRARRLSGQRDSKLLDRALTVLIEQLELDREITALDRHPYEDDADLAAWQAPPVPLPYDGDVPEAVLELARRRRGERSA